METTITAKIQIYVADDQTHLLKATQEAYRRACNYVSEIVFETKNLNQFGLHHQVYNTLRDRFRLKSQMAVSVPRTVIAAYKSARSNGHEWSLIEFAKPQLDLCWNKDYLLRKDYFSVGTLEGRIKLPYETKGMAQFFDKKWRFGTAKLVFKHKKWFLYIPMTKDFQKADTNKINNVVGIDLGINFLATAFDSQGKTTFFNGRPIKNKRAKFKNLRTCLQKRQTASSRRKLKAIGSRENRWMTDINHTVTKALVSKYGEDTLFVLEDLTGIRTVTERVRLKKRYVSVSWTFYQFRQFLEYKAQMHQATVIAVDPAYTSQTCSKCGNVKKANRNKKHHIFKCKNCGYSSNDDRISAINLQRKGIEYLVEVHDEQVLSCEAVCQPANSNATATLKVGGRKTTLTTRQLQAHVL